MRSHFVVAVAMGAGVAGRNEVVTKLIAQTRLIAVATSELPANLSGTRTQCLLDERIALISPVEIDNPLVRRAIQKVRVYEAITV
jgi:hypothetical protein